ncbi:MAG: class I SAM-dependent methyltransferase [Arenimonas sp.]
MIGLPDARYPKLSRLLPSMASEQVQKNWTGNSGVALLMQTNTFIRFLATTYMAHAKTDMRQARVLDFGCGYGRVIRSLYYYVNPENIAGVDPWGESVELCGMHGISSNIFQSDYLPKDLPMVESDFDLIYAFSVFTHLSERATRQSLQTLRKYISPRGILVITIRPVEYWAYDPNVAVDKKVQLEASHRQSGFAFCPHNREKIEGDITYGDSSMSLEWIEANFPEWEVMLLDRPLSDPYQIYLALRPK